MTSVPDLDHLLAAAPLWVVLKTDQADTVSSGWPSTLHRLLAGPGAQFPVGTHGLAHKEERVPHGWIKVHQLKTAADVEAWIEEMKAELGTKIKYVPVFL